MIDWSRIAGFEWDAGNQRKSADKHDVSQAEAEQVFFNDPLLMMADVVHSGTEARYHALGRTDAGRLLQVSFTLRHDETALRIISARPMSRKERAIYGQSP